MDDVIFDKKKISSEEMINAAKEIFNCQEADFQKLKQSKWYHIFLRAFTLKGHEKYIINDIKSLSKLQQLFIKCYIDEIKGLYTGIDETVSNTLEQNKVIEKLYNTCILKAEKQKAPAELSRKDMEILTLFLGVYENSDGTVPEEIKKYNRHVLNSLPIQMSHGDFDGTQLSKVSESEMFYRCFVEQCMVAGTLESQDWSDNVYNSLRYINLGEAAKERIRSAVKKEVGVAGIEYLYEKYTEIMFQFSDLDFELYEESNGGLLNSDEKAQEQGEASGSKGKPVVFCADSDQLSQKDAKITDKDIREIINKYIGKISGNLKRDNKEWEKILADSGYNNIAMPSVCAIFKSGQKKMIVTTCAVYYTGYIDKDKNWTIRYSDLKEVKFNPKEKTLSLQSDKKYTINWKKDFENLAEMFGEIQEKDQYPQSDRYIVIQNMGRINRIRYVAVADYIMKKSQCDDCEIFRLASKYKVEEDWEVIVNLISNDEGYKKTIQELMVSQELMYSQKTVAISLIADVCGSYLYAKDEYNLSISIKRSFGELKAYLKCDDNKNDPDEIISSTIEVAIKEKQFLENKISLAEYAKTIENFSAIVGAAGIFGVAYAFAWGPLWLVFMSFMPGIGQIAAAAVAGGLLIKKALNKTTEKKEKEIDLKKQKIYAYACEYAYAQKACERIGNYETAKKLKENRKRLFKKADISFSVRVPNVENDLIVQIRELFINGLERHSSWESYSQMSEQTILMLKSILGDVAEGNGVHFSEKDIIGIYKEKSWDDYAYMSDSLFCRCIVFCREGLLLQYGTDKARYIRYVDIENMRTYGEDLQSISLWIQPEEIVFVLSDFDYDLPVIYETFLKLFELVKAGCTVYS